MVHQLWRQFPRIQTKLAELQPYLLKAVNLNNQPIHHKVLQLLKASGKLLRPGFFLHILRIWATNRSGNSQIRRRFS